ncbi:MAG: threonine synthase [Lachnospiraceae bacterium]|nr:threonine synthase [Lachnospiraceae bacterium]
MNHVINAVCVKCGAEHEATPDLTTCRKCGGILDIRYDYDRIRRDIGPDALKKRTDLSMWRYREFLPVREDSLPNPATGKGSSVAALPRLRVGWSPFYRADRLAREIGLKTLYIKDDGINPTASLKDRASAMAVVKAAEAGAKTIACSSTGNAASSLAGNAAAAGFETYIFVPERAPKGKVAQLMMFGAHVISVKGSYEDTFRLSAEAIEEYGWYNRNAAINPYLMEGKKTVSFEIAEQLDFHMTDYVAVSVGDGCTIGGVWKGFKDLYNAGFIDRLPRLISVQAEGCCPINRAIAEGKDWEPMEENTIADSIAVGVPRNPDKALNAIRESNGVVVNVSDDEILAAMRLLGRTCGVFAEPAGATGTAGVRKAVETGLIEPDASVVSIVTGSGLKDVANAMKAAGEPLTIEPSMEVLRTHI